MQVYANSELFIVKHKEAFFVLTDSFILREYKQSALAYDGTEEQRLLAFVRLFVFEANLL